MRTSAAADAIQTFLATQGLAVIFDSSALRETSSVIIEWEGSALSDAIVEHMAPRVPSATVQHYTTLGKLRSICATGEFWLGQLSRRFGEGEYLGFCKTHRMAAADQVGKSGRPLGIELTDDLYYASFAAVGLHDEPALWSQFAGNGLGVRLTLSIKPKAAQLRTIEYGAASTLLSVLNDHLLSAVGKSFMPRGIWNLAAFYLPGQLNYEGETRLLVPDYPAASARPANAPDGVWPITIASACDPLAEIHLVDIMAGAKLDPARIVDACADSCLAQVPILSHR